MGSVENAGAGGGFGSGGGAFCILGSAELGLAIDAPLPTWLLVGLLGIAGSGANLAYVTLGDQFGPAMAGRAQTSLNTVLFLAAALLQSGIGWALDLLDAIGFGAGAEARYTAVLGLLLGVQVLSVLWFARTARAPGRMSEPDRTGGRSRSAHSG